MIFRNHEEHSQTVSFPFTVCPFFYVRSRVAWRNECEQHHADIISAVRETANEQIPYNLQGVM